MFRHTTLLLAVLLSAPVWAQADLPAGDWRLATGILQCGHTTTYPVGAGWPGKWLCRLQPL